jgi:hypothetical protein
MEPRIWSTSEVIELLEAIQMPENTMGVIEHLNDVINTLKEESIDSDTLAPGPGNQTTD